MEHTDFAAWLEEQINARGWKPVDLAKAAGQYPATINRILNRERNAGPDVCIAIADALHQDPVLVFRLAGLLPPEHFTTLQARRRQQCLEQFDLLNEENQELALSILARLVASERFQSLGQPTDDE